MFNKNEIERLNTEKANLQEQLEKKSHEYEELRNKYMYKKNEVYDYVSTAFSGFRAIMQTAKRSDFGNPKQKNRKIEEDAEKMLNYFGNLLSDMPVPKDRAKKQ